MNRKSKWAYYNVSVFLTFLWISSRMFPKRQCIKYLYSIFLTYERLKFIIIIIIIIIVVIIIILHDPVWRMNFQFSRTWHKYSGCVSVWMSEWKLSASLVYAT
jgi:hypothetical protein